MSARRPYSGPFIRPPMSEATATMLVGAGIALTLFLMLLQWLP